MGDELHMELWDKNQDKWKEKKNKGKKRLLHVGVSLGKALQIGEHTQICICMNAPRENQ